MTDSPETYDPETHDPGTHDSGTHDDSGLDLAKSVARGMARPGQAARQPGQSPTRRRRTTTESTYADERDPQPLDATMERLVADRGWSTEMRTHGAFTRWTQIVGAEVAQHCAPETFDADAARLVVRADSTAWATNLRLLAPTIVKRLAEELGDGVVTVVDVLGPTAPSWTKGPRTVRGRGPRDTYG
ncbi:MAG: DciA family protein [Nocardioidaceae bacterium]